MAWLKRFGLHLTAAIGATGIFVAAAAVGASQTRQQEAIVVSATPGVPRTRTPIAQRKPTAAAPTPTTAPIATVQPQPTPAAAQAATQAAPTSAPEPAATLQVNPAPTAARPVPPPLSAPLQPTPSSDQPPAEQQQPSDAPAVTAPTNPPAHRPIPKPAPTEQPAPPEHPAPLPSEHPAPAPTQTAPAPAKPAQGRSVAGTIKAVLPGELDVVGVGGHEWHVIPAPGASIRLNGKGARLDALQAGESVVILGQAQPGAGGRFIAHAITVRRK